jgi:uncharacterized membrane protein
MGLLGMSKQSVASWALLVGANIAALIAGLGVWNLLLMAALAVLSVGAGYWVLKCTGRKAWAVVAVAIIFLIGQSQLFLAAFTLLGWSVNGFAP